MKKLIIFALFVFVALSCSQKASTPELVCVQIRDNWGYINSKGEMVITPQFKSAFPFSDGLALVETEENGYCFLNKKGQFVNGLQGFYAATPFSEGLAVVVRPLGCPEVVNTSGKVLFRLLEAEMAYPFSEGLCLFSKKVMVQNAAGKEDRELRYGFVDTSGKVVIAPIFKNASSFKNGLAVAASDDNLYGFIDKKGRWVIKPIYSDALSFSEGLAAVLDESTRLWGYVNMKGVMKILPQFETCRFFREGLAYASIRSNLFGYINKKGRFIIQPQFEGDEEIIHLSVFDFSDGLAVGMYDLEAGKGGYINRKGKVEIPGIVGFPFNGPITAAAVLPETGRDPYFGIIDKKGNFVVAPVYENMIWDLDSNLGDSIPEFVRSDYEDMSWLQNGRCWALDLYGKRGDSYQFDSATMTVKKYIEEQDKTIDGSYSFKNHETMLLTFENEPSEELMLDHTDQLIKAGDDWYYALGGSAYQERLRREFKLKAITYWDEGYYKDSDSARVWCYPLGKYRGEEFAKSILFFEIPNGAVQPYEDGFSPSAAIRTATFTVKKGKELYQSGEKVADVALLLPTDEGFYDFGFSISGDDWYSGNYGQIQ